MTDPVSETATSREATGPSARTGANGPGAPQGHAAIDGCAYRATPWAQARRIAESAVPGPLEAVLRPLADAWGQVLAEPVEALTDLPSFDSSAMDGWAVAGPGPWRITATAGPGILAGQDGPAPLAEGHAVRIATGARVPLGTTGVLRSEHGELRHPDAVPGTAAGGTPGAVPEGGTVAARLYATGGHGVAPGRDIRPRGLECRSGDRLLPAGVLVTPAVLGLAAAAGYDQLRTVPRPRTEVLVLGGELLHSGLPRGGRIRDALGPMLGPWLHALGAEVIATRHLGDDAEALHKAVTASPADLVLTTGGTASGPVDHIHPVLRRIGAELLVDGVAVRPGHPMLLARLAPGPDGGPVRHLVGLPGNPLAAVSGLLTLAEPLLRTLAGRCPDPYAPSTSTAPLAHGVQGHPGDTRLIPVAYRAGRAVPLRFNGPAMLRGFAVADGLAVIPPGGAEAGAEVGILELPWSSLPGGATR